MFPHELQALSDSDEICLYRGEAWRGQATPYVERWLEFKGQRPKGDQLRGVPYPSASYAVREMRIYVNTEKRINVNTARAQRPGYPDGTSRYLLHASAVDDTARDSLSQ